VLSIGNIYSADRDRRLSDAYCDLQDRRDDNNVAAYFPKGDDTGYVHGIQWQQPGSVLQLQRNGQRHRATNDWTVSGKHHY
jgi:hypothetical protein